MFPRLFIVYWRYQQRYIFDSLLLSSYFKSSSSCPKTFVTLPSMPVKIGIIVTFMFYSLFHFSSKVLVLFTLFAFFQFYLLVSRNSKVHNFEGALFFQSPGLAVLQRFDHQFLSQNPREFWVFHFKDGSLVVHLTFLRMVRFKLLAQFLVDQLPHPVMYTIIHLLC